jgi:hypothetical protein
MRRLSCKPCAGAIQLPAAPGRIRRSEFEYCRGGTLAYLAAYDPHAARVLGRTASTTGIIRSDSWSSR